ncbi:MAG: rod shape-determining protein MreC [Bacteroidales bacterium]|nr:rod shape-determining protein MreC [Bacteroidales bacterium]
MLVFIALECISLVFVIRGDVRKDAVFTTSANYLTGKIYDMTWRYIGYFYLREENAALLEQLAERRGQNKSSYVSDTAQFHNFVDTTAKKLKYRYITAAIVKNSVARQNNFLTLDAGREKGVKQDMGVISPAGVVGIVVAVSDNFSLAISVLNKKIGFSAKLKGSNFYGSILWTGADYKTALLTEIPNYVELKEGDTVVTSGYSAVFPEGIPVATIKTFEKNSEDNFYTINVELLNDLKCVSNVFIIENLMQDEQKELESLESKFLQ